MGFPATNVEGPNNELNWSYLSSYLLVGSGNPEGAVRGRIGSIFLREDGEPGKVIYVKGKGEGTDEGWEAFEGSTNNVTYKTIADYRVVFSNVDATGTFFAGEDGVKLGTGVAGNRPIQSLIDFVPADYAVSAKTTKLRVRAQIAVNGTAAGTAVLTMGLYPITISDGGAVLIKYNAGTVVSGSTVAPATTINTFNRGNSGDFTAPGEGGYALACAITTAAVAANSICIVTAQLQVRNV